MPAGKTSLALELFERMSGGDIDAVLAASTDDIEFDLSRSQAPWRGVYRGRSELRATWERMTEPWRTVGLQALRGHSVGDRVAVESRLRGAGAASGIEVEARGGWLVSFRGDLVRQAVMFQSFDEALLSGRRQALGEARLYFVCEARPRGGDPRPLLDAALRGGVDLLQLRDKEAGDDGIVAGAHAFREAADEHGALFFVNDRPDLVGACDADGVHVGQQDMPVAQARRIAGPAALAGLSTHSASQFDAAVATRGDDRADQLSAGPVTQTPTKPGRPAAGLELIRHAAAVAPEGTPWFAIGGIDAGNVTEVVAAGAKRIVVVRAIRDAPDPEAAARELRTALG